MQKYIGLDVHKKFLFAVVLDSKGELIFEQKVKNDPHELDKFIKKVDKDSKVALESCSCWEYVYDYLTDAGFTDITLANPSKVRLIATSKKKTDAFDAKVLADLLRTNMLPESYAPSLEVRRQRRLTRYRKSLGQLRSVVKNKIHAVLIRNGINQEFSDVFGQEGLQYLKSLDLEEIDRYQIDNYIGLINHYNHKIKNTEDRIKDFVTYTPQAGILMSIPGVSFYSALMITGEIGDIRRFNCAKRLVSFAGLNPSVSQSGDRCYTGRIAKQGDKHLRWMLNQCSNIAIMHDSNLAKIYHRIKKKRGHNIALTAVSRKMLCFIYTMLTHNIKYQALQINKKAS